MSSFGRFLYSTVGITVLLCLLTLLGALVFRRIEAPAEAMVRLQAAKARQRVFVVAQRLATEGEAADWSQLVAQVDRYKEKLADAWAAGTDELTAATPAKWNFWGSVYYCFTLFTTIGYGTMVPTTNWGRAFTLAYALVSIPLCSLLIGRLSALLTRFIKAVYAMTQESSGVPVRLREAYARADTNFNFTISGSLFLLSVYLVLGGLLYAWALGTTANEWGPLEAIYFAFTSLTTIGLGDLVPVQADFLAVASLVYLMTGLALAGLVLGRFTEAMDNRLSKLAGHIPPPTPAHSNSNACGYELTKRSN